MTAAEQRKGTEHGRYHRHVEPKAVLEALRAELTARRGNASMLWHAARGGRQQTAFGAPCSFPDWWALRLALTGGDREPFFLYLGRQIEGGPVVWLTEILIGKHTKALAEDVPGRVAAALDRAQIIAANHGWENELQRSAPLSRGAADTYLDAALADGLIAGDSRQGQIARLFRQNGDGTKWDLLVCFAAVVGTKHRPLNRVKPVYKFAQMLLQRGRYNPRDY